MENAPKGDFKTGTTTVGVIAGDSVILAADMRASFGHIAYDEESRKLYKITENIAVTNAGAVGDSLTLVRFLRSQARLYDLVSGEEVGNFSVLDLTRLQNLFFTLVLVGAYAATLGNLFAGAAGSSGSGAPITEFPALNASIVALLGSSHGGYLVGKAANKQPKGEGS